MTSISFATIVRPDGDFVHVYSETWPKSQASAVAAACRDGAKLLPCAPPRVRKCEAVTVTVGQMVEVRTMSGAPLFGGAEWAMRFAEALEK